MSRLCVPNLGMVDLRSRHRVGSVGTDSVSWSKCGSDICEERDSLAHDDKQSQNHRNMESEAMHAEVSHRVLRQSNSELKQRYVECSFLRPSS